MKVLNAFSLNMVEHPARIYTTEITVEAARELLGRVGCESAVGHADTARVFSQVLGITVECRRVSVTLERGEPVIVGQYVGPRLPEGATSLPEGAKIRWIFVEVA